MPKPNRFRPNSPMTKPRVGNVTSTTIQPHAKVINPGALKRTAWEFPQPTAAQLEKARRERVPAVDLEWEARCERMRDALRVKGF